MDLVIAGNDNESLVDQLSFKLPSTAQYGLERRLVSSFPSGASTFSPNGGLKVMRFVITGEHWMDASTLRLAFKVRNNGAQSLQLASGPWCLFHQVRCLIGGTEIENLQYYGRTHELFRHLLMSNAWNVESTTEDFTTYAQANYPQVEPKQIGPGQVASMNLTLCLGLLQMDKLLPLKFLGGMQIELTLAEPREAVMPGSPSNEFTIEQPKMQFSTVTLDSALQNSFSSALLQSRALQFHMRTIHLQQMAVAQGNTEIQLSLTRALSRLAGVFISFSGSNTYVDGLGNVQNTPANLTHLHKTFLNPSAFITGQPADGTSSDESLMQWSLQIGSKNWPESQPCSSLSETLSLLRQATGMIDGSVRTTSITEQGYRNNQFVIGVPLQILRSAFSSINTRSGDLLSVFVRNLDPGIRGPGRVYVHMISEQIVELRESGVTVMD